MTPIEMFNQAYPEFAVPQDKAPSSALSGPRSWWEYVDVNIRCEEAKLERARQRLEVIRGAATDASHATDCLRRLARKVPK